MAQYELAASKIPKDIKESILDENLIDAAYNTASINTPMEYLFDVYQEFIDKNGEYDDWTCHKCRQHILDYWKQLKPYLLA